MKKISFSLFILCYSCFAQTKQIDSLKNLLRNAKEDTNQVNILNNLSRKIYLMGNYDSTLRYANKAKILTEKLAFKRGLAKTYSNIGHVYEEQGNYIEALNNYFANLKLYEGIEDKEGISISYNDIGNVYFSQGKYPEALKNYFASLKIKEKIGDKQGIASSYNNIGLVYEDQKNYTEATKNYFTALKIYQEIGDRNGIGISYNNIGNIYFDEGKYLEALKNHLASLTIKQRSGNKQGIASSYNNIGLVYYELNNYPEALKNHFASLKIQEEIGNKQGIACSFANLCATYNHLKKYKQAQEYGIKALNLVNEVGDLDGIKEINQNLSEIYAATNRPKEALSFYKAYITARDSLSNEDNTKRIMQTQMQYEFDKKESATKLEQEKKDLVNKEEKRKQQIVITSVSVGLFLVLMLAGVVLRSLRLNQKKNKIITEQKYLVEEKHREITDSINYAERIQRSFLATKELLDENLREYFVFFKPKDVVSGDFYWASKLSNNQFALVTADSTGHGVPGAIMSILNISSLEKAIEEGLTQPDEILNHTRINIIDRLKKDGSSEGGKDGMDCSLISFDFINSKFTYVAANNPVWIVRNQQFLEFASDKMPVGKHDKDAVSFTQHTVDMQTGDMVYTLTDGMPDQFGGPKGKKFMYKKLKQLLISIAHLPMHEQKENLANALNIWKANLEQVDDITLIGVRI